MFGPVVRVRGSTKTKRLAVIGGSPGWHVDQLVDASEHAGASLQAFQYTDLRAGDQIELGDGPINRFDAILTRTMPAGSLELVTLRLSILHEAGLILPVINPAAGLELAIDKYRTTSIARRLNLPTPPTAVCQHRSDALDQFRRLGGDVVVKPIFGGEGRGVMRVRDIELARTIFTTLQTANLVIHQQSFVGPGGRDRRVLVIGDHVATFQRTNAVDFRTNHAAGANFCAVENCDDLVAQSRALLAAMTLTIAAVDWIDSERGPIMLEVNAIPGWKSAQSVTKTNIAQKMIAAVLEQT